MLNEKLWIYMDLNIKAYDPYSLISSLSKEQQRNLCFPKAKTLYTTIFPNFI
jgi:hypothetical protein